MLTELEARKIIQKIIKRSFFEYFIDKKEPDTQHILLAKLFPEEMRKSSIIQGLQTSLGTTLWEKIAKEFAISSGFTIFKKYFEDFIVDLRSPLLINIQVYGPNKSKESNKKPLVPNQKTRGNK